MIVFAVVLFCVIRFKDRGQPIPEQSHGNAIIEYTFIAIPAALLAVIGGFTVNTVFELNETDDTQCEINVTGQQWWWEYDYPVAADGTICGTTCPASAAAPIVTSGQMVIPTDTNVLIRGTSRDVIHSFWVPKLNGKRDMVPGRVHTWRFQAWRARHLRRAVRRVLRSQPRQHADGDRRPRPARLPEVDRQPARAVHRARRRHVGGHRRGDLHRPVLAVPPGRRAHRRATASRSISAPDQWVYAGAAPNLTNLMTRNTFAGASWDLLTEDCRDEVWDAPPDEFGAAYLEGVTPDCLNEIDLQEWLRNAPAKKPMYADPDELGPDRRQVPRHARPRSVRRPDRRTGRLSAGAEVIAPWR